MKRFNSALLAALFLYPLLLLTLLLTAHAGEAANLLTLEKTIPLPRVQGRIDHMAADVSGQRLFVAALGNDTVEVVDLKTGSTLRSLPGFAEPQGIAYVPEPGRLFVANGADGTCRMLEGQSLKLITSVACGDDADNVRYDKGAGRIYVGYGNGALAVLDAGTGAKLGNIKLAGHPESFRVETGGRRIFVNVPEANHIAIIDRQAGKVIGTWPLKEARSNFPLFLDEAHRCLFAGCRKPPRILVYDYAAPAARLVASVPISGDTDDLFYDSGNQLLYVSCGQGNIEIVRQEDPGHYVVAQTIPTTPGARTSLLVPELRLFCLAVPRRGSQPAEIRLYKTH